MMQLNDKTVIITGASSGIGAAAAIMFAKEGANVVLGARRQKELDDVTRHIIADGGFAISLVGDVCDENFNKELVELAVGRFGGLDVGFNNAGMMGDQVPVADMSTENWLSTLDTNLNSAFYAAKHQIPAMQKNGSGSIIFTSSFVGHTASFPGMGAYAASKAGLVGLTQTLATEYGVEGIRANALLPGGTKTVMAGDPVENPEQREFLESIHALRRLAEPNEIAKAALFLASDNSSFVTGSAFIVDGGNSINKV